MASVRHLGFVVGVFGIHIKSQRVLGGRLDNGSVCHGSKGSTNMDGLHGSWIRVNH